MNKQRYFLWLFTICCIAFFIRVYVSLEILSIDPNVISPADGTDMATYKRLAFNISKYIFPERYVYQPFYYTAFLPSIFKLLGTNIINIIVIQSLLGAFTALLTACSTRILWNERAAIVAAILVTFSHVLVFYTPYLLIATLQAFWLSLIFYLAIKLYFSHKIFYCLLLGIFTGCAVLTRGNVWLIVPILALVTIYSGYMRFSRFKGIKKMLIIFPFVIFSFCLLIPMVPFITHNSLNAGSFRGTTNLDITFGLGNLPDSPPGGLIYTSAYKKWIGENNGKKFWTYFFDYLKKNKLSFLEQQMNKVFLFWDYREIPNNTRINLLYSRSSIIKTAFLKTSILIALGLAGILLFIPIGSNNRKFIIPLMITLTYWLSIAAFYNLARFRAPIIPLLCVYGGGFISYVLFNETKALFFRFITGGALLIFGIFFTFYLYDYYSLSFEPFISRLIRPNGIVLKTKDNIHISDNTSQIFDSWVFTPVRKGDKIMKTFLFELCNTNVNKDMKCEIKLGLYTKSQSELKLCVNSRVIGFDIKPGLHLISIKLPEKINRNNRLESFVLDIEVLECKGNTFFIFDKQRNYYRTILNNRNIDSELVAELIVSGIEKSEP